MTEGSTDSKDSVELELQQRRERRRRRWRRRLIVYTGILLVSKIIGCNHLFYYPDSREYTRPEEMPAPCEEIEFESADGTRLHGWFLRSTAEVVHGTVVFFHGNAQNLTSHVRAVQWIPEEGFHLFTFDYRGYGKSKGKPVRKGIHEDSLAALRAVRTIEGVDVDRLFVLGQSLGGSCALAAIGEGPQDGIRAIAAVSTFLWHRDVANDALGGTWFTYPLVWFLITNEHSPGHSIERLGSIPLLVLHGGADRVVRSRNGRAVYDAASPGSGGASREIEVLEGVGHNDMLFRAGRRNVVEFFRAAVEGEQP